MERQAMDGQEWPRTGFHQTAECQEAECQARILHLPGTHLQ